MPQYMKALKDNTKHEEMNSKHSSSSSSSSNFPSSFGEKHKCSHKAIEFACSACLCVCCPIIALWCCVKIPFRVGWCLVRKAKRRNKEVESIVVMPITLYRKITDSVAGRIGIKMVETPCFKGISARPEIKDSIFTPCKAGGPFLPLVW
nr:hypothetical protein CTI12_AA141050 [Tanacetum cinerariifolium]